jgi:uncharacterized protein YdcH (DUF465 family)
MISSLCSQAIGDLARLNDDYDPPSPNNPTKIRLGVDPPNQGECLMENNTQDELKAHLMATSEEFRVLAGQHCQLHQKLEELEAKQYLSDQEQIEEVSLKKQKLRLKDQMNEILSRSRAQQVA